MATYKHFDWLHVSRTRPSYEYRVPLVYIVPIAELEAVDTPHKNLLALKRGILVGL